jgi:hypothetical protein
LQQKTTAAVQEETSKKIRAAQQEIDKLADRLKKEKEKYQKVSNVVPVAPQQALKVCLFSENVHLVDCKPSGPIEI